MAGGDRRLARISDAALASAATLAVVVGSSWVADGLNDACLLEAWFGPCGPAWASPWLRILLAVLLFVWGVVVLGRKAAGLLPVRQLRMTRDIGAHRALIVALSPLPSICKHPEGGIELTGPRGRGSKEPCSVLLTGDIDADIAAFDTAQWINPAQQYLRCLKPHLGKLEHLVLIGTDGEGGSFGSIDCATDIARLYRADSVLTVTHEAEPVPSEKLDALDDLFDRHVRALVARGVAQDDIVLDVTGGQKPMSIAAAMTTLRWRDVEFQYVQTRPEKEGEPLHVLGFNVALEMPRTPAQP